MELQVGLSNTNNSIKHKSFVYTHLIDKTVLFDFYSIYHESLVWSQFKCEQLYLPYVEQFYLIYK